MKRLLKKDLSELYGLVSIYAKKNGVSEDVPEKDLWNCYFLDYLFNRSKHKDYFIFKGGTSLSKCFNLINRYSEDLDIVLDSRILGINLEEKMKYLITRNQKERFIDSINRAAMDFIENKIIPEIKDECEKEIDKEISIELNRDELSFYVSYPHMSLYGYIIPKVKIEMSSLSAIVPTEIKGVEPFINLELSDEYKVKFNVKCMKSERTFWEKVLILHQEANRVRGGFPRRYSRHYYDLYMIYNSSRWEDIINNLKLLDSVREFTMTFYNRGWSKLIEARPGSFRLLPNKKYLIELEDDYKMMSQMIFGIAPKFDEIIDTIAKIEKEINSL